MSRHEGHSKVRIGGSSLDSTPEENITSFDKTWELPKIYIKVNMPLGVSTHPNITAFNFS